MKKIIMILKIIISSVKCASSKSVSQKMNKYTFIMKYLIVSIYLLFPVFLSAQNTMLETVRDQAKLYATAYIMEDVRTIINYTSNSTITLNGGQDSIYLKYSEYFSNCKKNEIKYLNYEINNFYKVYEGSIYEKDDKLYCPLIIKWSLINQLDTLNSYEIILAISKDINGDKWYFKNVRAIESSTISESFPNINFKPVISDNINWIIQEGSYIPSFKIKLMDSSTISQKDLIGKPTLINFYYPGCMPCLRNFKYIENKILEAHTKDSFNVLTIGFSGWDKKYNVDYDQIKEYLIKRLPYVNDRYNNTIGMDVDLEVMQKFNTTVVPYTVLIDKKGILLYSCISTVLLLEAEYPEINRLISSQIN